MLTVHLRINDAASQQPTPVRLCITGPEGAYYPPWGESSEFPYGINEAVGAGLALGTDRWVIITGSCEVRLPAGVPLRIRATKGLEYYPLDETITLGPGQMAIRLSIKKAFREDHHGTFVADLRSHFLSPHDCLLEAEAEGLDVAHLLACQRSIPGQDGKLYPLATNLKAYSAQTPALSRGATSVYVGTENVHPALGSLALLNTHRVVHPISFGGDETDDWSVVDWCRQARRKKGLVLWTNPFEHGMGLPGGEALVAAILGELDAIEWSPASQQGAFLPWYYRLWNAGFSIPLVGSSGKDSNRVSLGAARTYVDIHGRGEVDYQYLIESIRRGWTVMTTAPVLGWCMDNHPAWGNNPVKAGETFTLSASADSVVPFEAVEVVHEGRVIARSSAVKKGDRYFAGVYPELKTDVTTWYAARCVGPSCGVLNPNIPAFAHTTPITVSVDGAPLPRKPASLPLIVQSIEKTKDWAERSGRYTDVKWKVLLMQRCDEAFKKLAEVGSISIT